MRKERLSSLQHQHGFTLLEVVCVCLLLAVVMLLSTRMFTNFVRGYVTARNADAAVQKAQNALQRMTLDFTYLDVEKSSGEKNSIVYVMSLDSTQEIKIYQKGSEIEYTVNGKDYPLLDGVASDSLQFQYFKSYDGAAAESFSSGPGAIQLVGISFTMTGDDPSVGLSQTYSTRVKVGKIQ